MANTVIEAGLRADIMRNQMESKNTLTAAGDLYIGTGTYNTTTQAYETNRLALGSEKQVLSVLNSTLGYNSLSNLLTPTDVLNKIGTDVTVATNSGRIITSGDLQGSGITVSPATVSGAIATTGNLGTGVTAATQSGAILTKGNLSFSYDSSTGTLNITYTA